MTVTLQKNFTILNNAISQFSTEFSELQNLRRVTDALNAPEQLRETLDNRLQGIGDKIEGLEARLTTQLQLESKLGSIT